MDQPMEVPDTLTSQNIDPSLIAMFTEGQGTVGVKGSFRQFITPIRAIGPNDQQYVFELPYAGGDYLDLKNTELYVRGNLTRGDGTVLQKDERVVLANNCLHSLFESVDVMIGHNQQEIQMKDYAHKAYFRQLMNFKTNCPDARGHGFTKESFAERTDEAVGEVLYGAKRESWTTESKMVEFCGQTFIDCFQSPGYLLPGTPVRITFHRSREQFYVTTPLAKKDQSYKFNIQSIGLYVPTIKVAEDMTPLLEMQTDELPARYSFESIEVRRFPFHAGAVSATYNRVFQGRIPSKIAVAFIRQNVYVGDRARAAFLTASVNVQRLQLIVNGLVAREHSPRLFDSQYLDTYRKWTEWLDVSSVDWPYDEEDYVKGVTFFPFDFMENCKGSKCDEEALLSGSLDITVQTDAPLGTEMIMLVYALSPDAVEIMKERTARYVKVIV